MQKTLLKGGSLSQTSLIEDGQHKFVRKEVSLSHNREYGYQRLVSQLKRQQRYNLMFPGLFPTLLQYGVSLDKETAYFDMEYMENYPTAHHWLCTTTDPLAIAAFTTNLIDIMELLHGDVSRNMPSCPEAMDLYLHEEVYQKLHDCKSNQEFVDFTKHETLYFNGEMVPSLTSQLPQLDHLLRTNYLSPIECFSHGNLTLENVLYSPTDKRIVLIDVYEENIIDSKLCDYSQLLQSCHANYERYNIHPVKIVGNHIICDVKPNYGITYFGIKFNQFLKRNCTPEQIMVVKLLEITQLIRLLPFKAAVAPDRMILFYGLASKLLCHLQQFGAI